MDKPDRGPPLHTLLGDYPNTLAFKQGRVWPTRAIFDFAPVKTPHTAFKRAVRDLEFDICELAIVTFLMARAHGKPLVLMPAEWSCFDQLAALSCAGGADSRTRRAS